MHTCTLVIKFAFTKDMSTATLHHIVWRKSRVAMRFVKTKHVGLHVRTTNECRIPITNITHTHTVLARRKSNRRQT